MINLDDFLKVINDEIKSSENKYNYNNELHKLKYSIKSKNDSVIILVMEPGMNKDNSKITIVNRILNICTTTTIKNQKKEVSLNLSESLDLKTTYAECKDGILKIEIKKVKEENISIKIN